VSGAVLDVRGLRGWYGPALALDGIDLELREREIVGLLGRNGAGKTTTFRAIMGIDVRLAGAVEVCGAPVEGRGTDAIARRGVGWVPDDRRVFADLTVEENLLLASRRRRRPDIASVLEVFPALEPLMQRIGSQLSGGQQQMVAIARALVARPRVLLLDEPAEGLAPLVVSSLEEAIRRLPEEFGIAVLLAEQNLRFVLGLASRVYVLETGQTVYEGPSSEFAAHAELQQDYLSVSSHAQGGRA
jgi:ABC-type branched-subunit amino acid transport system ATPase component